MPSWKFSRSIRFWVLLWAIPGVCPPQVLLQALVILFFMWSSVRPFCYVLSVSILLSEIDFCVCWFALVHSPPTCLYNFISLFCNLLFCLHCLTLSSYLLRPPSFANILWFISSSCIVKLVCCFFIPTYSYLVFIPLLFRLLSQFLYLTF